MLSAPGPDSLVVHNDVHQYVKTAKCRYDCANYRTTVYHIFARIPTQDE